MPGEKKEIKIKGRLIQESKWFLRFLASFTLFFVRLGVAIVLLCTRFVIQHRLDIAGEKVLRQVNNIRNFLPIRALEQMIKNGCLEYAGYLAYLNIFSLMPLVIALISLSAFFGQTELGSMLLKYIIDILPESIQWYVGTQILKIAAGPSTSLVSVAFIGALWTVTSTLEGFKSIFNRIYSVKHTPFFLVSRLISAVQFLIAVFTILITIFLFLFLPKILNFISSFFNYGVIDLGDTFINSIIVFCVIVLVVASVYNAFIDTKLKLRSLLPGAVITTILWFIFAKKLFGYMYNSQEISIVYGGISDLILILAFFYIMNLSLLYGMQFNYLLSLNQGLGLMAFVQEGKEKNNKRAQNNRRP